MTSPVELPVYGKFKKTELSKEELLAFWNQVLQRVDFRSRKGEKVEAIAKGPDGIFMANSTKGSHRARAVILAIGKIGSPRKLGVKGEELTKVLYRLSEGEHYIHHSNMIDAQGHSAHDTVLRRRPILGH